MSTTKTSSETMSNYRWIICSMLFFATAVNYLDRQVLSLTWKDFIAPEFHWTDTHYGTITAIFSIVYAIANLFAGRFVDWLGSKKGYLWAIAIWSLGACLHALCGWATEMSLGLKDVNEMIITSGPGSYTGVRVAMTIAKTLAAVSDVRIKSVSSLAAYAGMNQALSVIDARGHKVFVGVYENGLPLIKEQVVTLEDFAHLRAEYEDFELVGEVGCLGLDEKECDLCANIYALGQMADPIKNVDLLVPTYIKDVEAKKACY